MRSTPLVRFIRKFGKFCMWLVLGLLCTVAILGSKPGLQLLRFGAEQMVPGLQIQSIDGSLWQGLQLQQLQLTTTDFDLTIEKIELTLNIDCALAQKLCLERPSLQGVHFKQHATSTTATATPAGVNSVAAAKAAATVEQQQNLGNAANANAAASPAESGLTLATTEFRWPVMFSITDLAMTPVFIELPDASVSLEEIKFQQISNLPAAENAKATAPLQLIGLQVNDLFVTQTKSKAQPQSAKGSDAKTIISQVSAIKLPFAIALSSAKFANVQIKQQKQLIWQTTLLQLSAELNQQVWHLQQFKLENSMPQFSLQNTTRFEPANTQLTSELQLTMAKQQLALTLEGPLHELVITGDLQSQEQAINQQPIHLKAQIDVLSFSYDVRIQADNLDGYLDMLLTPAADNELKPSDLTANNLKTTDLKTKDVKSKDLKTKDLKPKNLTPTSEANSNTKATASTSTSALHRESATLRSVQFAIAGDLSQAKVNGNALLKWPNLPATELKLQTVFNFAKQQLLIEQLQVLTLNGSIQGQGQYEVGKQQLDLQLTLAQLLPGLFWVDYPGQVNGKLQLSFSQQPLLAVKFTDIAINGELRDKPLSIVGDFAFQQMPQDKNSSKTPNKNNTKTAAQTKNSNKLVAEPMFDFVTLSEQWQLSSRNFMVAHGPNYLKLNGELAKQWQLAVELAITDLSYSLALSEGQIQGDFSVSGDAKNPIINGKLSAKQLSYLDDYALADLQIEGNLVHWGQQTSRLTVVASQGQTPDYQLQKFEWRADGTFAKHQSILLVDSHQLQLASTYQGSWTGQLWRATIDETRFKSDIGDWQLQAPLTLELDTKQQSLTLADSCWQNLPAVVCLKASPKLSKKAGTLQIALTELDLTALDPVFPSQLSLNGRVNGSTNLRWQNGKLALIDYQIAGEAGAIKLQTHTLLEIPWQHMQFNGKLDGKKLTSALQLQLEAQSQFDLQLELSELDKARPHINAKLKLDPYQLKFLQPLMNEWTQFNGKAAIDLAFLGAIDNPDVRGKVVLDELVMSGKQAPIELLPSKLNVEFFGYQSLLSGNVLTPDGELKISGQSSWRDLNAWSARLDVQSPLLKLHLMDAEISMSPDLSFSANPLGGEIRGLIKVPQANLKFDSLPENAIRVSDDEVIISADIAKSNKSNWKLSSDVKLQLGDKVRLAAFGLKTRLEGELRLRQSGLTPTIHGTVHLKDGNFRAYGQDLQLRKGRLIFNGQADQPMLAIEAIRNPEKTEDDVIAGLRVNGVADNPVVEVFSEPGKPQANALAYLLLGRDIGSSAGDGSVTAGLIGIGIANSGRLVGKLGEAFGVSDLSLDTAGSGDKSKVTVSGYLSPKLQIKYGVGIFNQLGEFTLRYRLMKQLYIEGVTGVANSADLLYKMEFN